MRRSVDPDLVREIAERIDDGRRVNLRSLSRQLNVDFMKLYDAYGELAEQRGCDPLLDRARRHLEAARRMGARR